MGGEQQSFCPPCIPAGLICPKQVVMWLMPVILPLKRLRQEDCHEHKDSLGYKVNFRPAGDTE